MLLPNPPNPKMELKALIRLPNAEKNAEIHRNWTGVRNLSSYGDATVLCLLFTLWDSFMPKNMRFGLTKGKWHQHLSPAEYGDALVALTQELCLRDIDFSDIPIARKCFHRVRNFLLCFQPSNCPKWMN